MVSGIPLLVEGVQFTQQKSIRECASAPNGREDGCQEWGKQGSHLPPEFGGEAIWSWGFSGFAGFDGC